MKGGVLEQRSAKEGCGKHTYVAHFASGFDPVAAGASVDVEWETYEHADKRRHVVVARTGHKVDYVGDSGSQSPDKNTQYALMVFDPSSRTLEAVASPAPAPVRMQARIRGVSYAPSSSSPSPGVSQAALNTEAHSRLTSLFGSARQQRLDSQRQAGLMERVDMVSGHSALAAQVAAPEGGAVSREEQAAEAAAHARRSLPRHDPYAHTAEHAYRLRAVLDRSCIENLQGGAFARAVLKIWAAPARERKTRAEEALARINLEADEQSRAREQRQQAKKARDDGVLSEATKGALKISSRAYHAHGASSPFVQKRLRQLMNEGWCGSIPASDAVPLGLEESCTFLALLECLIQLHNGPGVVDPLYSRVPRALLAFLASRVFNSKNRFTYGLGPQGCTVLRCWILVAALRSTPEARLSQEDVEELAGELGQSPASLTKLAAEVGANVLRKDLPSARANAVALLPDRDPNKPLSKAFGTFSFRTFR